MAKLVPELGELSYNGVSFGPYTRTTSVSARIVETTDGRSVRYHQYTCTFESHIRGANQAEVDAIAVRSRQALTKNGMAFVCTKRAIGDFRINVGNVRDVNNGPKVSELSFEPAKGDALVSVLRWQITFCIPECQDAAYRFRAMDFSFSLSYNLVNGYTTRTVRGALMIPQNRFANGERFPQDSADYYREQVFVEPPEGFRPVPGINITLSPDRGTINFDYAHTEMGRNITPPGLVEWDMSQTMTCSTPTLAAQWQITFTGNGELKKDGQFRDAVVAFFTDVRSRMLQLAAAPRKPVVFFAQVGKPWLDDLLNKQPVPVTAIPIAFTATEPSIYGQQRKVSMSITFQSVAKLETILNSGIWTKLPTQNAGSWRRWWLSVKDTTFHPRGYARLEYDIGDDRITDLCDAGLTRLKQDRLKVAADIGGLIQNALASVTNFDAQTSWIHYDCSVKIEQDTGNSLVRTMPDRSPTRADDRSAGFDPTTSDLRSASYVGIANGLAGGFTGGILINNQVPAGANNGGAGPFVGNQLVNTITASDNVAVRGRKSTTFIIISGTAIRAGFPVPEPSIKTYAGLPVMPDMKPGDGYGFVQSQKNLVACPMYSAKWSLRYAVEGDMPKNAPMQIPRNILFPGAN